MDQQNPGTQPNYGGTGPQGQPPVQHYAQVPQPGQPDLVKRGIALFIDSVIVGVAYFVITVIGGIFSLASGTMGGLIVAIGALVAAGALLLRDVALQGRSPGKKIMGLAVVTASGGPITAQESIKRNLPLAVGLAGNVFAIIPFVGWIVSMLASIAQLGLFAYELYRVAQQQPRLGDQIAGTQVVLQGQPAIAL